MAKSSSLKSTLAVSLNNYLDAGAIVAGASGVTLWQNYLGLTEMHLGWLNALSAKVQSLNARSLPEGNAMIHVTMALPQRKHLLRELSLYMLWGEVTLVKQDSSLKHS